MASSLIFVFHPATGVQRIRREYMVAYEASGFRFATALEVARWYEERGLPRPRRLPVARPGRDWYAHFS